MKRHEHYTQALAFIDWIEKLTAVGQHITMGRLRADFVVWAETKDFHSSDEVQIWRILRYAYYTKSGKYRNPNRAVRMVNQHKKKNLLYRDPETVHRHTYGAYHKWIKKQNCAVIQFGNRESDCLGKVTGHHVVPVGRGGRDKGNEVPLCVYHHAFVEDRGRPAFEKKTGVDLEEAARYWEERHAKERSR